MTEEYFGIDSGGTNVRVGKVNPETGELVKEPFTMDISHVSSNKDLLDIIRAELPDKTNIGISAAGDVDEENLVIKLGANSKIHGEITYGRELKKLGHNVTMTNDMKAATQAESKYGQGKDFNNVLVATYSSGYNCAVVKDGKNASTAEFGHLVYKPDGDLFCGCGGKGHLETYVSGSGAAAMAKKFFFATHQTKHTILSIARDNWVNKKYSETNIEDLGLLSTHIVNQIKAEHVYKAFKINPKEEPQQSIRNSQVKAIANSFGMMVSVYNPIDIIILMGSQTKDWDILFQPAIEIYHDSILQLPSLNKPIITVTELPEIGVQGAVAYFLSKRK